VRREEWKGVEVDSPLWKTKSSAEAELIKIES
jgi:hypothetical protein